MIKPRGGSEYRGGMLGKGLALVKEVSAEMILSSEAILRQFSCPPLAKLQRLYIQIHMQNTVLNCKVSNVLSSVIV